MTVMLILTSMMNVCSSTKSATTCCVEFDTVSVIAKYATREPSGPILTLLMFE